MSFHRLIPEKLRSARRIVGLALVTFATACPGAPPPFEVASAATNGLQRFLAQIPPGSQAAYGFPEGADLAEARLGEAVCLEAIDRESLRASKSGTDRRALVKETTQWFFPVRLGSELKAMLIVDRQDGTWRAVSLGYAPLAREWGRVLQSWPPGKGYHPRLVACFEARRYYFQVPEAENRNLTAIQNPSPVRLGPESYRELRPAEETVDQLRRLLQEP